MLFWWYFEFGLWLVDLEWCLDCFFEDGEIDFMVVVFVLFEIVVVGDDDGDVVESGCGVC